MMAGISSTCTNLLPVDLRLPATALLFPSTTSSGPSSTLMSPMRCERRPHQRRRGARLVASAVTTEPPSSVVGDMERGSLAEKSGRSDGQLAPRWREIHGRGDWEGLLDPIDTVLRGELIRYGEFAQACYDAFDYDRFSRYCGSSRYPPPTFFRDVGLDGVGYEVTRFLYATSNARLPNFVGARRKHRSGDDPDARLWSETASFIGFVAVSTDEETARIGRRDIAVAWRGTVTRLEWVADLTAAPRPAADFGIPCPDHGAKVESGFAELYTGKDPSCRWCRYSAREQVLAEVRKLVDLYHGRGEEVSVTVTGHSLGSALATLSAFDVAETGANVSPDGGRTAPVCVFSFSGPRVGNTRFKTRLERELGVKVLRVVNVHDMVPTVPGVLYVLDERSFPEAVLRLMDNLGMGAVYVHVGVELALDHKVSPYLKAETLDLACFHNLEAHLHLLDGYQGRAREFRLCGRDPALVNKAADFLRDEHMVPPVWRQDANKGMVRAEDGRWVLPPRHREVHDHPEDTDHHLQRLGLAAN
ncbi:phospholipase A1-Igamma1, chloroplastic [Sorghum bicolor]|uniref:phospholipase A1-Igamma1, chloroplastic n=1 Tax=Sorghum bicolor TaxID=4558 RepID=UPI00081AC1F3|nr:phospholipase A1-Igamma1, chloroplastic [Sorghum bicolor]|eukprot:XP_002456959.2 phospholipase A1-Igamma1, chloroplastic [Sorghum bicolor]